MRRTGGWAILTSETHGYPCPSDAEREAAPVGYPPGNSGDGLGGMRTIDQPLLLAPDGREIARYRMARSLWERFRGLMLARPLSPGEALWLPACAAVHTAFVRSRSILSFCVSARSFGRRARRSVARGALRRRGLGDRAGGW